MPRDFDVCVSKVDLFFSLAERVAIYEITSPTSVHPIKLLQPTRPYQRQKMVDYLFLILTLFSMYYYFSLAIHSVFQRVFQILCLLYSNVSAGRGSLLLSKATRSSTRRAK